MASLCIFCGKLINDELHRLVLTDRRKGIRGSWSLVECGFCGVISMEPIPADEVLAAYYASYYDSRQRVDFSPNFGSRHPMLRKLFHRITGDVDPRDFINVPVHARILDYGCGYAGYLRDFYDQGVAISGAEIASYAVDACRDKGYDVHKVDDLNHIPFPDNEFDIVYLMQVFEHLRDPHLFMDELSRVLKPGGLLYLALPNSNSVWRKFFGKNWVSGWFVPFHLFHYNRNSLGMLSDKHGFDMVESWSNTPIQWFKLNLKAYLFPNENKLDWHVNWFDNPIIEYMLMFMLRVVEWFFRERDCLVVTLSKRN